MRIKMMMAVAHFSESRKGQEESNSGLALENITDCLWHGVWSFTNPGLHSCFSVSWPLYLLCIHFEQFQNVFSIADLYFSIVRYVSLQSESSC